jgi:hypothetical protein
MNIKGSQLVGSPRNEVVFMPYLDMQQKVVIGLQLAGAGLVSKQWQRENVGIPDSEAMDEEIVGEAIQDAVLALLVQTITDPEAAESVDNQAIEYIEGGHTAHPLTQLQPPPIAPGTPGAEGLPLPSGGGGGGGGPTGQMPIGPIPGGTGQVEAPPIELPPGAPVPGPAPGAPAPATAGGGTGDTGGKVLLDDAIRQFQAIQGLQGRVFLVGQLAQTGETSDVVPVDITDNADRDTVARGVQFPVKVKVIQGEPNEPFVEVTPGASTALQGQMPEPDEALAG